MNNYPTLMHTHTHTRASTTMPFKNIISMYAHYKDCEREIEGEREREREREREIDRQTDIET